MNVTPYATGVIRSYIDHASRILLNSKMLTKQLHLTLYYEIYPQGTYSY